jgi:phosphatidylserine/phosphatidylglycerophosphate/cardiolipin synthase-like enzyme
MRGMIMGLLGGLVLYHLISVFFFAPTIVSVFSPYEGHEIVDMIDKADSTIDIEVYAFTSRDIVEALERAKQRGVKIRIILETINREMHDELLYKGFDVRYAPNAYKTTHSKIMIVDGKKLLVGSHNFSNSALYKNREASVIISDMKTVNEFIEAFEYDWLLAS